MRSLLDECIDEHLRHQFIGHDCQTARYAGFKGVQNGKLLLAAESAGFEVLVTVDQNIADQQNFSMRRIALLILGARTSRLADLSQLVPFALEALGSIKPGQVIRVS